MTRSLSYEERKRARPYLNWKKDLMPECFRDWMGLYMYNRPLHDALKELDQDMKKKISKIVNLATNVKNPTEWWICAHKDLQNPSEAEKIIMRCLEKYSIEYYREIEFAGLKCSEYGYYRYDILLKIPTANRGIVLIEYDSVQWHNSEERKAVDKIKTKFCKDNGIRLVRYDKNHYYKMESCIDSLLLEYKVYKRNNK